MGSLGEAVLDLTADPSKLDPGLSKGKSKITESLGGMRSQLSAFGGAAGVMMGNLAASAITSITSSITSSLKNSFQGYMEYADQVRATSRSLGVGAEEASRLIQVADDVTISYQTLATSMKLAQKNGIDPSIEGLAKLADQYLTLAPGVERTQFLLDTFGKSGEQMGQLMEKGGDGIRNMSEAIDENMILTQEALDQQREYEVGVDALSDAWTGLTYEVMPSIVKGATSVIKTLRDWGGTVSILIERGTKLKDLNLANVASAFGLAVAQREAADSAAALSRSNSDATGTYDAAAKGMSAEEEAAKALEEQLKATSQANQQALNFTLSYADFMDSYADNHKKAVDKVTKAQEELMKAQKEAGSAGQASAMKVTIAQRELNEAINKYGEGSTQAMKKKLALDSVMSKTGDAAKEINKAKESLTEAQTALTELEASWHEKTQRMIYDMILTKLSVDGLTDAEYKAALEVGVTMGVLTQAEAQQAQAMMDVANATVYGIEAQEALKSKVDITTKAYLAQADAAYKAYVKSGGGSGPIGSENKAPTRETRDSGGVGKAGQPYLIGKGAQPELFIPEVDGIFVPNYNGSLSSMKGNGMGQSNTSHTSVTINNPKPETASRSVDKTLKNLSYLGVIK